MSKKNLKHKKKKSFPWLLLALGGLLIVAAVVLFTNPGDGGGAPVIAVDQQKIDFGDVKFGVNKTFSIKVTNTGSGTLRFSEQPYIQVLEGC